MPLADDSPARARTTDDDAAPAEGVPTGGAPVPTPRDATERAAGDGTTRRDPTPDAVPGRDDAGAGGRDRAHGGWGDRGIGGGRAGGTGL